MNLLAGFPYSLIKHGLPYQYPPLTKSIKADVIILGGGISGALAAYSLTLHGISAVVVDGRTIGLGSTCASTSLLQYEIDVPLVELMKKRGYADAVRAYELCKLAIEKLDIICSKIKAPEFTPQDSVFFAATKKDTPFLQNEFTVRKQHGFNVEYLEEKDLKRQYGFTAPGAILSHHGASTDAYTLTHALHQFSIKKGLQVFDRTYITSVTDTKNGVILKTQQGHILQAKKLIYATGYEVTEFVSKKIVTLNSTYASSSENLIEADLPQWAKKTLLWNTADPYLYMRATPDNRIIIGGRDEKFSNAVKRDNMILKKSKMLTRDFKKLFPDVPYKPEFNWTGTFGSTADGLPFIGTYSKFPNSYFALGFGGNGITFSLIAAEIITDLLLQRKNKDAAIFSFERI